MAARSVPEARGRGGVRAGAGRKPKPPSLLKENVLRSLVDELGAHDAVSIGKGGNVYAKRVARLCKAGCGRIILREPGRRNIRLTCRACALFAVRGQIGRQRAAGRTEAVRAKERLRDYRKRSTQAALRLTTAREIEIRAAATVCARCDRDLTDESHLPNSKHLDHIVPLGVGGLHIEANVRVLCLTCNVRRPKDGRDEE